MHYSLKIEGMTCQHCSGRVKTALEEQWGESGVKVSHETGSAQLESPIWITYAALRSTVEQAGYELKAAETSGSVSIPVYGMHCGNCATKVQSVISDLDGPVNITVDLEHESVALEGPVDVQRLEQALEQAGFSTQAIAPVLTVQEPVSQADEVDTAKSAAADESKVGEKESILLSISGMSCASCVNAVEVALRKTPGVMDASVNFADQSALLVVEGNVDGAAGFDIETLITSVKGAGYGAAVVTEDNAEERQQGLVKELRGAVSRSALALVAGALLMGGTMTQVLPAVSNSLFWMVTGVCVLGIMIVTGGHFYRGAYQSGRHLTTTMDTLIALGTGTAWLYSMLVLLAPQLIQEESRHLFFEAALFILGFINLGKALEANARGKTSEAIQKLIGLTPETATLVEAGEERTVLISAVSRGDLLRIKPGEAFPVDGRVVEGASSVDESMLTGEPMLIEKELDDTVSAGTINQYGTLLIEAVQVGSDTSLSRIVGRVREAQNSKPRIGRLTDRISSVFVPAVIVISLITVAVWGVLGPEPRLSYMVVTGMSVLIIACPCALGLATPMSIMVGVGRAAENGILIRNGEALQAASQLTTMVLDKTGTLTVGKPDVVAADIEDARMLDVALSLELLSEHPLARAVVGYCHKQEASSLDVDEFIISPGGGIKGVIDGNQVVCGNPAFLASLGIELDDSKEGTVIYVCESGNLLGSFTLADQLKPDSVEVVSRLRSKGLKVIMLTGDSLSSASRIAGDLEVDEIVADALPEKKLEVIRDLQARGEKVGMVGDGINDALALSLADVGFAMGQGTDIAVESADISLLGYSLEGVVKAIDLSRLTMRNIYQNLIAAFAYNITLIPVAAGVLFPFIGLLINPALAGLAMALSSVTVVSNSSRLKWARIE